MDVKNRIPVVITIAAAAYAIIAIWQAMQNGSVMTESICLAIILLAVAVLSWSCEHAAEILTARKGAALWLMIVIFIVFGLLKGGGLI